MTAAEQRWRILIAIGKLIITNVIAVVVFGFNVFTGIGIGISVVVLLYLFLVHQTTC
jgi:hypothetical protein